MAINITKKFLDKVAEVFTKMSFVKPHTNNNLEFSGAKTVKVYMINTVPEVDYKRGGANRMGELQDVQDTVFEYTVTQDKAFTGVVDNSDQSDQAIKNKAGKFLKQQLRQVSTPNADKYALRKFANYGQVIPLASAPTKSTIVGMFADAMSAFDDALVPDDGRIAYVKSSMYKLIAQSDEFIKIESLGEKAVARGQVGMLYGFKIIKVPTSYLPDDCYFLCMHESAACMPYKIKMSRILKEVQGIDGAVVEGHHYYDAFVFGEKADAVYAAVATGSQLPAITIDGTASAMTITCSGAKLIKYTVDGSDPRFSASALVYSAAAAVPEGSKVRAVAFADDKFTASIAEKEISA